MLLIFCRSAGVGKGTMSHVSPVEKQCHSIICMTKLWTGIFLFAVVWYSNLCAGLHLHFACNNHHLESALCLRQTAQEYIPARCIKNSLGQLPLFSVTWCKLLQRKKEKQRDILKEHSDQTQIPQVPSCPPTTSTLNTALIFCTEFNVTGSLPMVQIETSAHWSLLGLLFFWTELQYSVVPPATLKTYPWSNNRCNPPCLRVFLLNFS